MLSSAMTRTSQHVYGMQFALHFFVGSVVTHNYHITLLLGGHQGAHTTTLIRPLSRATLSSGMQMVPSVLLQTPCSCSCGSKALWGWHATSWKLMMCSAP